MSQTIQSTTVSELDILNHISTEWTRWKKRNKIQTNSCILAANFAHRILDIAGVPHFVRPVGTTVFNRVGWELFGIAAEELPPEAWSVHCSSLSESQPWQRAGYCGHLIIETNNHFLDLTADAFSRPEHGILITQPLVVPLRNMRVYRRKEHEVGFHRVMKVDEFRRFPLSGGVLYTYYYEDWNIIYKKALDWQTHIDIGGVKNFRKRQNTP